MLESLLCNSCGAPLQVSDSANYVKCNHCNASLKVHRSIEATTTEAIEKLVETTEDLSDRVDELTRQNKLEAFDRRWANKRESFMIPNQHHGKQLATRSSALMGGFVTTIFGGLWTVMAIAMTQSGPDFGMFRLAKVIFPLFGLGFITMGIWLSANAVRKAKEYESAEKRYRKERKKLSRENR